VLIVTVSLYLPNGSTGSLDTSASFSDAPPLPQADRTSIRPAIARLIMDFALIFFAPSFALGLLAPLR